MTLCDMPSSAFACWSSPGATVAGTSAIAAGPKKAEAAPKSAAVTTKRGSVIACMKINVAVTTSTAPRTTSQLIITVRREKRSANTPPTSEKTTRESANVASTTP
jgi:hypothetical protein